MAEPPPAEWKNSDRGAKELVHSVSSFAPRSNISCYRRRSRCLVPAPG